MLDLSSQLEAQLSDCGTAPFLFVGSGISRRYLGLEDWSDLLRRCAEPLERPYEYYYGKAESNLPKVASLLAEDFYELWWSSSEYEESRRLHSPSVHSKEDALKFEIARYLQSLTPPADLSVELSEEIELLKQSCIDGVVTTNWDTFLESTFGDYRVFVGQQEVLFSPSHGVAEIYKIHGCVTQPQSLVLSRKDYDAFNGRNAYLAARLLTTFVDHPVVFLGYSLSDANVTQILGQVISCLSADAASRLQDRLIFVQRDGKEAGEIVDHTVMQIQGRSLPITIVRTNDFRKVFHALTAGKRRFPARLLRVMKEQIYELVLNNDPKGRLAVLDIEKAGTYHDLEVVFGVGLSEKLISDVGYKAVKREDLLKDVVDNSGSYDPQRVLFDTLPKLLRGSQYVPVFKYLKEAGRVKVDGLDMQDLDKRVVKCAKSTPEKFLPPEIYRSDSTMERVADLGSLERILASEAPDKAIFLIPLLETENISVDRLREFLLSNLNLLNSDKPNHRTYTGSLICLYDLLAYGPEPTPIPEQFRSPTA